MDPEERRSLSSGGSTASLPSSTRLGEDPDLGQALPSDETAAARAQPHVPRTDPHRRVTLEEQRLWDRLNDLRSRVSDLESTVDDETDLTPADVPDDVKAAILARFAYEQDIDGQAIAEFLEMELGEIVVAFLMAGGRDE